MPTRMVRGSLFTAAGVIAAVVVVDKTMAGVPALIAMIGGDPPVPVSGRVDGSFVVRQAVWIVLALAGLGCVVAAGGGKGAGLGASHETQGVVVGGYFSVVTVALVVSANLVTGVAISVGADGWLGRVGVDLASVPLWYWAFTCVTTAVVEGILVVAVPLRLLQLVSRRVDGRSVACTGWATAALVALRVSCHSYYGLTMIAVAVMAWLTVRLYRHNRSLAPMIVAHIVFNMAALSLPIRFLLPFAGCALLYFYLPSCSWPQRLLQPFGFVRESSAGDATGGQEAVGARNP